MQTGSEHLALLAEASQQMQVSSARLGSPPPSSGAAHLWTPSHPQDCAIATFPTVLFLYLAASRSWGDSGVMNSLLEQKLEFFSTFNIVPDTQRCALTHVSAVLEALAELRICGCQPPPLTRWLPHFRLSSSFTVESVNIQTSASDFWEINRSIKHGLAYPKSMSSARIFRGPRVPNWLHILGLTQEP
jgi:hypothetical protein